MVNQRKKHDERRNEILDVAAQLFAEKGYEVIRQLLQSTLNTIVECPCQEGCPSCIQSPKCGNNNEPLDKKAAQLILKRLLF